MTTKTEMSSEPVAYLEEPEWRERERTHEYRTSRWVQGRLVRQRAGKSHPVEDFLFDYYRFRPAYLQRWSPGSGVVLCGSGAVRFLSRTHYSSHETGVWIRPRSLPFNRREGLRLAIEILSSTLSREPQYGCYGLHEWAMVYRLEKVRHEKVPLRMPPDALVEFVNSQRIRCSHYDAFRFFTPAARPLNVLQPEKAQQPRWEQGGCLHTNMDLYKWAFKFSPWVPSELIADTFELARRIREIDMRASPYDLRSEGYQPIAIETAEGRAEYENWQKAFSAEAQPLRKRLLAALNKLLADSDEHAGTGPLA